MRRELSFLKNCQYSPAFRSKRGHDDEILLDDDGVSNIPNKPGVYIIVSEDRTKFVYPLGRSSVIYIGKADNLHRRLLEHLKSLKYLEQYEEDWLTNGIQCCPRYQYIKQFGAKVYTFHCLGKQDAKNLEADIIWKFYEKYRAIPVGNGARSFSL